MGVVVRMYGKTVRKSKKAGWKKVEFEDWEFEPFVFGSCELREKGAVTLTAEQYEALQAAEVRISTDGHPADWWGMVVYNNGEDEKIKMFLQSRLFRAEIILDRPKIWWVHYDGTLFA